MAIRIKKILPAMLIIFILNSCDSGSSSKNGNSDNNKLLPALLIHCILNSCGPGSSPGTGNPANNQNGIFQVVFNSKGGSLVDSQSLAVNSLITRPDDPVMPNHTFGGWYTVAACTEGTDWDFTNDRIDADVTLYAKWTAVSASGLSSFSLINDPYNPTSVLAIIYDKSYSGTINYIASKTDLGIANADQFKASAAAKVTVNPIAADSASPVYDDYIRITTCSSGTTYYVYILDTGTDEVKVLTQKTRVRYTTRPEQETGEVVGTPIPSDTTVYKMTYTITFPGGYDLEPSKKWPFLIIMNGPAPGSDANFPCITFTMTPRNSGVSGQVSSDFDIIANKVTSIIENPSYRIDKSRIYACGFSIGACGVLRIANNETSSQYSVTAIVANGASDWLPDRNPGWTDNLNSTNLWLCWGENDPEWTQLTYSDWPHGSGDHLLSVYPGLGHTSEPTWVSPYTWMWMLSK